MPSYGTMSASPLSRPVRVATVIAAVYIAFVFIQSLFFKFTGSVETDYIFGTLDAWASDLTGVAGLFAPGGIFSAYVIGTAELVASILVLAGVFLRKPVILGLGALMSMGVMTGAIFFHLFTPLGVEILGDGGLLFGMACFVWLAALAILILNRHGILAALPFGKVH